MPKPNQARRDEDDELPSTIKRSPAKAQRTWQETHHAAVARYGEGERAHRVAYASLKHSFEKRGDRWVEKKAKGASDPRSTESTEQIAEAIERRQ